MPGWIIFGLGSAILLGFVGLALATLLSEAHAKTFVIGMEALFCVPLGAYFARYGWQRRLLGLAIFEHGFEFVDRKGSVLARFDDIARVFERVVEVDAFVGRKLEGSFRFELNDGRAFVVEPSLPRHLELGRLVAERAQDALAPSVRAALESGHAVAFGSITVQRDGIRTTGHALPWASVAFVRWERVVYRGSFAIYGLGDTLVARVPSDEVANTRVFLDVLESSGKLEKSKVMIWGELLHLLAGLGGAAS
jgi:hypothetical protein